MLGCGTIIAVVLALAASIFMGMITGSVWVGIIMFVCVFFMTMHQVILGMGDANRATQDIRDKEIVDELKNISDKLDKE